VLLADPFEAITALHILAEGDVLRAFAFTVLSNNNALTMDQKCLETSAAGNEIRADPIACHGKGTPIAAPASAGAPPA
jgi:hypothetical protein